MQKTSSYAYLMKIIIFREFLFLYILYRKNDNFNFYVKKQTEKFTVSQAWLN